MQTGMFYLHEDEWAMIDLVPSENFEETLRVAAEARAFGQECIFLSLALLVDGMRAT